MSDKAKNPATVELRRYLGQQRLIRNALSQGIERALDTGDDVQPGWEEQVLFQLETTCIRTVDNFLSYIAEMLQLAFAKRPEMLRSSETITVEQLMRFSRHGDLVSFVVDRTISRLAYKNFTDIEKYVREKTGIELLADDNEWMMLIVAIELRNIYTHNRGLVSEQTLDRLERFNHPLTIERGKPVDTDMFMIEDLVANMEMIARRADEAFARKFRLVRR